MRASAREGGAIDQVAAIAGQRHAVAGFGLGRARLGILAGKTPDADHPLVAAVNQDQAHLQQDLQLVGDRLGAAVVESLAAVAALQQESLAVLRPRPVALRATRLPNWSPAAATWPTRPAIRNARRSGYVDALRQRFGLPGTRATNRFSYTVRIMEIIVLAVKRDVASSVCYLKSVDA